MNEAVRRTLCDLVAQYGRVICDDPRRCEGLLKDLCGEHKREIFVVISALKEGVSADLISASESIPTKVLHARLRQRLCDNLAFSEVAAKWAVETLVLALGTARSGDAPIAAIRPDVWHHDSSGEEIPEQKLRVAIYEALNTNVLTAEAAAELLGLGRQLNIASDDASLIFQEVQLQRTIEAGNIVAAGRLLSLNKRLVNSHDSGYGYVLHRAFSTSWEMTKLLISYGADVNAVDRYGFTMLHHLAMVGDADRLHFLIGYGADVNMKSASGETALSFAVSRGHCDSARILFAGLADISVMNATALHWAVFWSNFDTARTLLYEGADANSRDSAGATPLHWAARFKRIEMILLLIEHGADVDAKDNSGWTGINGEGDSPLGGILEQILQDQDEPYELHIEVATTLIASGASIESDHMLTAAISGNADIVRLLTTNGADVNMRCGGGTALHVVASRGYWKLAQHLVDCGAKALAVGESQWTPLHSLAYFANSDEPAPRDGHAQVSNAYKTAQVLIAAGADVNAPDARGYTPLAYTRSKLVEALLKRHGAR